MSFILYILNVDREISIDVFLLLYDNFILYEHENIYHFY